MWRWPGLDGRPDFAPEPFTPFAQRSAYQSMRSLARRLLRSLGGALPDIDGEARTLAASLIEREPEIQARFGAVLSRCLRGPGCGCTVIFTLASYCEPGTTL